MTAGILSSERPNRGMSHAATALLLMLAAAVLAYVMTPRIRIADQRQIDLETAIPQSFGEWKHFEGGTLILPDPETEAMVDKIYNKVLSRIYARRDGTYVMLVIAYGGDQSDALQLHRPEVCYAAAGFNVTAPVIEQFSYADQSYLVTRVETREARGYEPVSYWMRVGDRQVTSTLDRQWVKLRSGLSGVIPDGVLVRISSRSTSADPQTHFDLHDRFVTDLLAAIDAPTRALLVGGAGN